MSFLDGGEKKTCWHLFFKATKWGKMVKLILMTTSDNIESIMHDAFAENDRLGFLIVENMQR